MSVSRQPGQGRYSRAERERRWLVASVPAGSGQPRRIEDRYLEGTSLRLRRVEDAEAVVFKLGQKIRADPDDPFLVRVTNLYLTAEEYRRLSVLPAAVLVKTRRLVRHGAASFAVDEFEGRLRGLVLAETDLAETEPAETDLAETEPAEGVRAEAEQAEAERAGREAAPDALPRWLGREVTHDDRYSGATLARAGSPPAAQR
ncbi:MAG TPA: hypothetical protein VGX49_02030 [Jatrophihabitans sp.]|nr:hypothetical protein [Jatrophihabitans sp.]